jgi:hypothetical protein
MIMSEENPPFVAVVGGFRQLDEGKEIAAQVVAKAIGVELAKAGFGVVVYMSHNKSLEPYVVAGYLTGLAGGPGAIRVRYAESQRGQVKFDEEAARPEVFEHRLFPGQDWEAPFYRSLTEEEGVDAVLLVAGGPSTLIAGQIAVARRLPVLAVDEFGGAAGKIWNQLAQASPEGKYRSWGTQPAAAFVVRLKTECAAVAEKRKEARRREQAFETITGKRHQAIYAAGAFAFLLAALFFGMVYTPIPSAHPFVMFLGLIAAGATGSLVRSVLWGPGENDPRISLLLGSVAGFVVGLAYLIPQWVGAPGVLATNVDSVSATEKIQFASAVLVAVSAGVGFDTVFSRLQKQAENAAVGPPQ